MAIVNITNTKLKYNEAADLPATVAITSADDGIAVDYTGKSDGRILLIIENSDSTAADVTIEQGNGLQGVEDMVINIGASGKKCIVLESGKFANVYGEKKGKVVIKGSTKIKAAAVELP